MQERGLPIQSGLRQTDRCGSGPRGHSKSRARVPLPRSMGVAPAWSRDRLVGHSCCGQQCRKHRALEPSRCDTAFAVLAEHHADGMAGNSKLLNSNSKLKLSWIGRCLKVTSKPARIMRQHEG